MKKVHRDGELIGKVQVGMVLDVVEAADAMGERAGWGGAAGEARVESAGSEGSTCWLGPSG
eukprot:640253-Alexandrium_andersonii.AAC.1